MVHLTAPASLALPPDGMISMYLQWFTDLPADGWSKYAGEGQQQFDETFEAMPSPSFLLRLEIRFVAKPQR